MVLLCHSPGSCIPVYQYTTSRSNQQLSTSTTFFRTISSRSIRYIIPASTCPLLYHSRALSIAHPLLPWRFLSCALSAFIRLRYTLLCFSCSAVARTTRTASSTCIECIKRRKAPTGQGTGQARRVPKRERASHRVESVARQSRVNVLERLLGQPSLRGPSVEKTIR